MRVFSTCFIFVFIDDSQSPKTKIEKETICDGRKEDAAAYIKRVQPGTNKKVILVTCYQS